VVYALSIGPGEFIKIGYTGKAVEERVAQLQTGCPFAIKLLFTTEGNLLQEKELHKSLKRELSIRNLPLRGEWYPGKEAFMRRVLDRLRKKGCNSALAYLDKESYEPVPLSTGLTRRQKERLKESRRGQREILRQVTSECTTAV
jgi:hypothetical protein